MAQTRKLAGRPRSTSTEAAAIVPAWPIRAQGARLMDPGVVNTGRVRYPPLDRGGGRTLIFVTEAEDKARSDAAAAGPMPVVPSFERSR